MSDSDAAPELEVELRVFAGWDPLALDARLDATNLADVVLGERLAVHDVVDERAERLAELRVAGDDARLARAPGAPR